MLKVANVSEFRRNLKSYIDGVADRRDTLIVNSNGKSVVVLSLDDYNAMDETDYLLSSEANKEMMFKAKAQIEANQAVPVKISDMLKAIEDD
jgi:antitoxin YefM